MSVYSVEMTKEDIEVVEQGMMMIDGLLEDYLSHFKEKPRTQAVTPSAVSTGLGYVSCLFALHSLDKVWTAFLAEFKSLLGSELSCIIELETLEARALISLLELVANPQVLAMYQRLSITVPSLGELIKQDSAGLCKKAQVLAEKVACGAALQDKPQTYIPSSQERIVH